MEGRGQFQFGEYRLDPTDERLWRGDRALRLPPRAFAVLRYLVEHADRLVTKDELLSALWPGAAVGDAVLAVSISELRHTLRDAARTPRFIETVHRRGYRFHGPVTRSASSSSAQNEIRLEAAPADHLVVGRDAVLARLRASLARAASGTRQVVFVTGEPGIGKTTVVDHFLRECGALEKLWIARGRCVEAYGAGEPYLPVLDAVSGLCGESGRTRLVELLRHYAPTWLVQFPSLVALADHASPESEARSRTTERMLREIADYLEALAAERPLLLVLEDLQWSDPATGALVSYLATRPRPARFLVLGTYRPMDVLATEHPFKTITQELHAQAACTEVALEPLTVRDVEAYFAARFSAETSSPEQLEAIALLVHGRTDGNPLFMVNLIDDALEQGRSDDVPAARRSAPSFGALASRVPDTLRELIEHRVDALGADVGLMLEAASVAGHEFTVTAVAAALGEPEDRVEARCDHLARREQFVASRGFVDWPDGTIAAQYGFRHALYAEVLYQRLPAGRRARWHQRIGEREEAACGKRAAESAAALAAHFERGGDAKRAVHYCREAGENARRRSAYAEASAHLTRGLQLLERWEDTEERARHELALRLTLGMVLAALRGWSAPEVGAMYLRAVDLGRQLGDVAQLGGALAGMRSLHSSRAEHRQARELGEEYLRLAEGAQDVSLLVPAHASLAMTALWMGEPASARLHGERAFTVTHGQRLDPANARFDVSVSLLAIASLAAWLLGYLDDSVRSMEEATSLVRRLAHPLSTAHGLSNDARLQYLRRDVREVARVSAELVAHARDHAFPRYVTTSMVSQGWAAAMEGRGEEGIALMTEALALPDTRGLERPLFLLMLAEAYEMTGRIGEALTAVGDALVLVDRTEERVVEAELHRRRGELMLRLDARPAAARSAPRASGRRARPEAEACFQKALAIARHQQAKVFELRAATSLARLWRSQGQAAPAAQLIAPICAWFTQGLDTTDLQEAKALIGAR